VPLSAEYLDAAMAKLQVARQVTYRKMFGGAGLYLDGIFFGVLDNDATFFKHETARDWVIDGPQGGAQPYIRVPEAILADPAQLGLWIDASVEWATRKKSASKRKN